MKIRLCEMQGRYVAVGDLKQAVLQAEENGAIRLEVLKNFFDYLIEVQLDDGHLTMIEIAIQPEADGSQLC